MEKFEIVRSDSGWRARYKAGNNEIVWWTETYTSLEGAQEAVEIIRKAVMNNVLTFTADERTTS